MILLGWDSLPLLELRLRAATAQVRSRQGIVEDQRARIQRNTALASRWLSEWLEAGEHVTELINEVRASMTADPSCSPGSPDDAAASTRGFSELEEYAGRHPGMLEAKNNLEHELLTVEHRYVDWCCVVSAATAFAGANSCSWRDGSPLAAAYTTFESSREKCVTSIERFEREFLRDSAPA